MEVLGEDLRCLIRSDSATPGWRQWEVEGENDEWGVERSPDLHLHAQWHWPSETPEEIIFAIAGCQILYFCAAVSIWGERCESPPGCTRKKVSDHLVENPLEIARVLASRASTWINGEINGWILSIRAGWSTWTKIHTNKWINIVQLCLHLFID